MKQRRITTKRKLVPASILGHVHDLAELGVPVAKLLREQELGINLTSLRALLAWYDKLKHAETPPETKDIIAKSLFPPWLAEANEVQGNPDGWYYLGFFPLGEWKQEHADN